MSVVVVGINHRSAGLDLLERLAIPAGSQAKALADLVDREFVTEAVVLSTCHRVEVYAVAERFHGAMVDIRRFFSSWAGIPPEDFSDHLYDYHDEAAVAHLFGVAAGLDSVVPGEAQVLGQVREAWERARVEGTAGSRLTPLFRHALEVGKRARSETAIARGITSLPQAAVALAEQRIGTLGGTSVVVLGAGEISEGMAVTAAEAGDDPQGTPLGDLVVANRTLDRADRLARRVGGRAVSLGQLEATLEDADVLFASTGSASVVVDHDLLGGVMARRPGRPLLVVDLGLPRDVDPGVRDLPDVTLLDLDDLQAFVDAQVGERRGEMTRVGAIVDDEVTRYVERAAARQAAPTITALRRRAERLRQAEAERHRSRLSGLDARQQEAVDSLVSGVVNKLLHEPTVRLKSAAGSARGERLTEAIRELFDL